MNKEIKVNNIDSSSIFTRYGYSVTYKKIMGDAGGDMLDGSTTVDVIAVRPIVTFGFMPVTEDKLSEFIANLYKNDYAQVYYFDLREREYKTIEAIYSDIQAGHRLTGTDGSEYWFANTITFEGRSPL
mgnify:FL=1